LPIWSVAPEQSGEPASVASESMEPHSVGEQLILLADDNIQVRTTTADILEEFGYSVLTASDGEEGWSLFQARPVGSIALVILDIIMPHIDGLQLAKMIREVAPEQTMMFITGYDQTKLFHDHDQDLADIVVFSKPYTVAALAAKVQELIECE
ncbi:MAG: response regulator, partial [Mariprofundales bacterium]|nr:response regulator [Mariprofundales bacterium]